MPSYVLTFEGNTCYLNSALQVVLPRLKMQEKIDPATQPILFQLQQVLLKPQTIDVRTHDWALLICSEYRKQP